MLNKATLALAGCVGKVKDKDGDTFDVVYVPEKKDAKVDTAKASTLSLTSSVILADSAGEGSVNIAIRRGAEKTIFLQVRGADPVDAPRSGMLQQTAAGLEVIGDTTTTLMLKNLIAGRCVAIALSEPGKALAKGTLMDLLIAGSAAAKPTEKEK